MDAPEPTRDPRPLADRRGRPSRAARAPHEIWALFDRRGHLRYDEAVSQETHARQCAHLAATAGAPPALVVAALLHDIGHLLDTAPDVLVPRHQDAGARWLQPLFPEAVLAPIRLHVDAKRSLCATDPAYRELLSEASVRSLVAQGGPMTADELARFHLLPAAAMAIELRTWDDRAKDPTAVTPPLSAYHDLVERLSRPGR